MNDRALRRHSPAAEPQDASTTARSRATATSPLSPSPVAVAEVVRTLQRTAGNAAVQKLLASVRGTPREPAPLARYLTRATWQGSRVLQRQDPRHLRGRAGEQALAFTHYRWQDGWGAIRGPSGEAGHGVTQGGEDGLFWNQRTRELHIVDNKSLARRGSVASATAIDPERNLLQNIDDMIEHVERHSPNALPMRQRVLRLLRQTRAALRSGSGRIPGRVRLIVGNAGGRSTGVSARLQSLGVEFVDVNQPVVPRPGTARPALRGGAASTGGAALGFAVGIASAAGRERATTRQREASGYAPVGAAAFADEDFLSRVGRWVQDPYLGTQTSPQGRFDIRVWRRHVRRQAENVPIGGTFTITWQWHRVDPLLGWLQTVEDVVVRYEKQRDASWIARPRRRVAGFRAPDLGRILDESVPDEEIRWELLAGEQLGDILA